MSKLHLIFVFLLFIFIRLNVCVVYLTVMPASLATEMNSHASGLEDQRALQIALELSKLGLSENEATHTNPSTPPGLPTPSAPYEREPAMKKSANMTECVPVPSSEHVAEIVGRQGKNIYILKGLLSRVIECHTPVRCALVMPVHV